ncbi:hypothetical protein HPB47_003845, partial [Ixodes persulcatus]
MMETLFKTLAEAEGGSFTCRSCEKVELGFRRIGRKWADTAQVLKREIRIEREKRVQLEAQVGELIKRAEADVEEMTRGSKLTRRGTFIEERKLPLAAGQQKDLSAALTLPMPIVPRTELKVQESHLKLEHVFEGPFAAVALFMSIYIIIAAQKESKTMMNHVIVYVKLKLVFFVVLFLVLLG